ncbi:hypothetical protein V1264_002971 [Littorina saxatilis]|uniref:Uncharacterized protein n=1 Tax=Littorina saxatilis TaxID=31220 RepID=A0AAN9G9F8_9CAEN
MTSVSILAITLAFLATFVAGNGDIVTSFFRMVQRKKMPPEVCQEVSGSRSPTKLYCANTCDVTATCQSFSFTCTDTDPRPFCRCFLCFTADLGAATTVPHTTTGVRVTKTSPPATADRILTSTDHFESSTASTENPTTLPQHDVTTSLSFSISTATTEISSENPAESPSTASAVLPPGTNLTKIFRASGLQGFPRTLNLEGTWNPNFKFQGVQAPL